MSLALASSLESLIKSKYKLAQETGALVFAPSQLVVLQVDRIVFQLRYCPGLAQKPGSGNKKVKQPVGFDPFENPSEELLVTRVPAQNPTHMVVLNKFPIIENHFILATKRNVPQTHLLDEDDLSHTYECLVDWESKPQTAGKYSRCFAFYNSGEHSGASQPHRHLQLLPVEDMVKGSEGGDGWSLLVDSIMSGDEIRTASKVFKIEPNLPFVHFGCQLPRDPSPHQLRQIYIDLYNVTLSKVQEFVQCHPDELELHSGDDGRLPISYNLAMTTNAMVMCPRRKEGHTIKREDGSSVGIVALNGTLLAGTVMVKNEELFGQLRDESWQFSAVLESIGIPRPKAVSAQM